MAPFNRYLRFLKDLVDDVHELAGTKDTLRIALTNAAPDQAAHAVLADIGEIPAGNGYDAGGLDTQNEGVWVGGELQVKGAGVVFTARGGPIGPFRYAVLYNDTPAKDPLIGWWDHGSALTLIAGETLALEFDAPLLTIA